MAVMRPMCSTFLVLPLLLPAVETLTWVAGVVSTVAVLLAVRVCHERPQKDCQQAARSSVMERAAQEQSTVAVPECLQPCKELSQLPEDLAIEIARTLDVSDLASFGAVNIAVQQNIWQEPRVWRGLATRRGLHLPTATPLLSGSAMREAFRRHTFNLNGDKLDALSTAVQDAGGTLLAKILYELAHIACGLMPCDGEGLVESLSCAAEQALQAHDPTHTESAAAAEQILHVVRQRDDIFSWLQRERLEYARASAIQLQALMEDLCDKTPEACMHNISMEVLCDVCADSSNNILPSTHEQRNAPRCSCASPGFHGDVVLEAAHEEQRLRELCALFGDLCSQVGFQMEA